MPRACMYCGARADSREHIIATRFIDVLRGDPRGYRLPSRLTVTLPDGRRIIRHGKTTRGGAPTLEYTTRVCGTCNSGWMNDMDTNAYNVLVDLIRGHPRTLSSDDQRHLAAWFAKVALTARSEPANPLYIDPAWTHQLFTNHTPPATWYIWIGRYEGSAPWWYQPTDVRVELGAGSPAPDPAVRITADHGVYATLVIGCAVLQIFGVETDGQLLHGGWDPRLLPIWPTRSALQWPPQILVTDASLPDVAQRLIGNPQSNLKINN